MPPTVSKSSGKIVIKPPQRGRGRVPAATRPTIRIGPRVVAAAVTREETPTENQDGSDSASLAPLGEEDEQSSSLTSNAGENGALDFTPQEEEVGVDDGEEHEETQEENIKEEGMDVDVDVDDNNEGDDGVSEAVGEDGDVAIVSTPKEAGDEGRQFKAQTFTLPNRHPTRKYMLAIDAARTSGFRDSLYYFRRNPLAFKLNANQWEKDHLIEIGKLGSHLRTRSVTLITARSAYKLHGAKMILEGRWVVDDYNEEKVLAEITERGLKPGDSVGELVDTSTIAAEAAALAGTSTRDAGKQDRGGPSGGTGIYRAGGPTTIFGGSGWGPYSDGPLNAVRKSLLNREGLNEENWMWMTAQRTLEAGDEWKKIRQEGLRACGGILGEEDIVSEVEMKRAMDEIEGEDGEDRSDTQPLRSRWEVVHDPGKHVLGGTKAGNGAWGVAWVDTVMELPNPDEDEQMRLQAMKLILEESEREEVQAL
ncbi:hypothetical protein EW026_g6289 [Hermanssonia centrifuga]|uniref:Uncharacterized protein n=1 Tax=Hermanssonia centrifuga TaxID=98765 RepID=A0A4S4KCG5_9APHY|nr:hypothetical protein EW026_g6289 [Hermanssonia centrifuga]